jgi:hypothetical protein
MSKSYKELWGKMTFDTKKVKDNEVPKITKLEYKIRELEEDISTLKAFMKHTFKALGLNKNGVEDLKDKFGNVIESQFLYYAMYNESSQKAEDYYTRLATIKQKVLDPKDSTKKE